MISHKKKATSVSDSRLNLQFFIFSSLLYLILADGVSFPQNIQDWTPQNFHTKAIEDIKIADFNDDGNDDLLVISNSEKYICLSNGFNFDRTTNVSKNTNGSLIEVGDLNSDGMDDLLLWSNMQYSIAFMDRLDEKGILTKNYNFLNLQKLYSDINSIKADDKFLAINDFNDDCLDDIVYLDITSSSLKFYLSEYNEKTKIYSQKSFSRGIELKKNKKISIYSSNIFFEDGIDKGRNQIIICQQGDTSASLDFYYFEKSKNFKPILFFQVKNFMPGKELFFADLDGDSQQEIIYKTEESNNYNLGVIKFIKNNDSPSIKILPFYYSASTALGRPNFGDFNGDGYDDICFISPNKIQIKITKTKKKDIGAYYTLWYHEKNNSWSPNRVDINKKPAAGWSEQGIKEYQAPYSSQNRNVQISHFKSMKQVGVDFVIADMSNGWPEKPEISKKGLLKIPYGNEQSEYHGDQSSTNGLSVFLKSIKEVNDLKFCFMIGLEFQGPDRFFEKQKNWKHSWSDQFKRIEELTKRIRKIIASNPNKYYYHLGKPLLMVYLNKGYDYPPRDYNKDNKTIPNWDYLLTDFTVRYTTGVLGTFDNQAENYEGNQNYREGKESKFFWTWGAGRYDKDTRKPDNMNLPKDSECMTVMPGQNFVNYKNAFEAISRKNGNFYKNSWKQVLNVDPNIILITDWNNWSEETAIEKCYDCGNGWENEFGKYFSDYYLRLTKNYVKFFKEGKLIENSYVKSDKNNLFYQYVDGHLKMVNEIPSVAVPILLPESKINLLKN